VKHHLITGGRERTATVAMVAALALAACSSTTATTGAGPSAPAPSPSSSAAVAPPPAAPAAVPAKYQGDYARLSADLDGYEAAVTAMPALGGGATGPRVIGAELLAANGNQQTALLLPGAMTAVDTSLDAFKRLGITGVTLGIKMPLLLSQYTPQAAQYTDFYAAVADQARSRGMTVEVELGALFCGTVFSHCSYQWPTTVQGWAQITAQQARIVIDRIHPTYLDIMSEPNTEANLTGIKALGTVSGVVSFTTDALGLIGARRGVLIGAGAASWFGPAYDQAIVRTPIDVLIDHIYPVDAGIGQTLVRTAEIAHQAGKPIVADELWLYKTETTAGANVDNAQTDSMLDMFSFFAPLDQRFLSITREWAGKAGVAYASAFWSAQLLTYLAWTPALDVAPYQQVQAALDEQFGVAARVGTSSITGLVWTGRA